jgi:hypothetical protein
LDVKLGSSPGEPAVHFICVLLCAPYCLISVRFGLNLTKGLACEITEAVRKRLGILSRLGYSTILERITLY